MYNIDYRWLLIGAESAESINCRVSDLPCESRDVLNLLSIMPGLLDLCEKYFGSRDLYEVLKIPKTANEKQGETIKTVT